MKPDRIVAKVRCCCGNVVTIRTTSDATKTGVKCWYSNHNVWFKMRGFMIAEGHCVDVSTQEDKVVDCWIDYQGK